MRQRGEDRCALNGEYDYHSLTKTTMCLQCESKKRTWLSDARISHPRSRSVQNGTACTLGTGAAIETRWRQLENAGCVKQLKSSESPAHFVWFISRVIGLLMGSRSIKVAGMATATSPTPPARCTTVITASAYAGKWYVTSVRICN